MPFNPPALNQPSFAPNDNFKGVGDFVSALTGGAATRKEAYESELGDQATLNARLAKAAMITRQNQEQARISAQMLIDSGLVPDTQAPLAAHLLRSGGGNANELANGLSELFKIGLRSNAVAAAQEPDAGYSPVNAQLVGLANGPQQTSAIQDGNLVLDRFSDAPAVMPTEGEKARIGALLAQGAQRQAAANASNARADVSRRTDPNRPRGGKPKAEASKPAGKVPAVGAVMDGYRFKGGDPANPKSWEKV